MIEWWDRANTALISEKAPISLVPEAVAEASWQFRRGTNEMFDTCDKNGIPILVFSAGITDVIDEMIKQRIAVGGRVFNSLHVISNKMRPDESGTIVGFMGSVIHVFNKNEHAVAEAHVDWWGKVKPRKNVILLGDSPGDVRIRPQNMPPPARPPSRRRFLSPFRFDRSHQIWLMDWMIRKVF
jgi:cytosolic 5'-nucleotidase 3